MAGGRVTLTPGEKMAGDRARELLSFLAGFEDAAGHPELCRRARLLAADVADLVEALRAERSASSALAEARDRLLAERFPGACT
jgi:hypothetical protein